MHTYRKKYLEIFGCTDFEAMKYEDNISTGRGAKTTYEQKLVHVTCYVASELGRPK